MRRGLALALLASLLLATPVAAQETRKISVTGESTNEVPNDRARVRFSVEARRRTPGAALRTASARMRRVLVAVRAAGVASRDIQTLEVRVARVRGRRGRPAPRRYVARNRVQVTVRDIRRAGALINAGIRAGATGVGGPDFFRSNARALYVDLLTRAFDDAKAKAERLARHSGLTLGRPLEIRERGFEESVEVERLAPAPGAAPVEPGTTEIDAQVFVTFEAS